MANIRDFKYKLIKNFLTPEETGLLKDYARISHRINRENFDRSNVNLDSYFYGHAILDALLLQKWKPMEEKTGLKLLPTFCFLRIYTHLSDLVPHTDRPSCEISVTAMLGSCGTEWPIYMEKNPINLEPGDGAIYLGCEVPHKRLPFKGDWHAQVFLHYVDANGKYKNLVRDERPGWGYGNQKELKPIV